MRLNFQIYVIGTLFFITVSLMFSRIWVVFIPTPDENKFGCTIILESF